MDRIGKTLGCIQLMWHRLTKEAGIYCQLKSLGLFQLMLKKSLPGSFDMIRSGKFLMRKIHYTKITSVYATRLMSERISLFLVNGPLFFGRVWIRRQILLERQIRLLFCKTINVVKIRRHCFDDRHFGCASNSLEKGHESASISATRLQFFRASKFELQNLV